MHDDFCARFLAARDKGLSPRDSWLKKEAAGLPEGQVDLCFMRPLEYLEWRDWEEVLVYAAHSDGHHAVFEYRFSCSEQAALMLIFNYQNQFLTPFIKRGILMGGVACNASPHQPYPSRYGTVSLSLFGRKEIPQEHLRLIPAEEFHKRLESYGCRQKDPPRLN